jgi:hypothetical protein
VLKFDVAELVDRACSPENHIAAGHGVPAFAGSWDLDTPQPTPERPAACAAATPSQNPGTIALTIGLQSEQQPQREDPCTLIAADKDTGGG